MAVIAIYQPSPIDTVVELRAFRAGFATRRATH
jgi:hypothetical protein